MISAIRARRGERTGRRLGLWLFASAMVAAAPAWAGSVYLNGVNIDQARQQMVFPKVDVRLDGEGNVYIDAPGYKVQVQDVDPAPQGRAPAASPAPTAALPAQEAPPGPARLTRRYWLVTSQSAPGMTEYDIDLFINSRWIRKLESDAEPVIAEITRHLVPGRNTVLFRAHKRAGQTRKSFSSDHVFKVVIGTGNVGGSKVLIDSTVAAFERDASQTEDASQEVTFVTQ